MNQVVETGRIASDIELKYMANGKALATFSIAVKDPYRKNEEGKPGVNFFDVTAWGQPAEFVSQYLMKGSPVGISGELRQNTWKTDSGDKRSRIVINALNVESLGPNPTGSTPTTEATAAAPAKPAPPPKQEEPDYDPFADDA